MFDPLHTKWSSYAIPTVTGNTARRDAGTIVIPTTLGPLVISFYRFGARIRLGPERQLDYGLIYTPKQQNVQTVKQTDESIIIESGVFSFELACDSLAFALRKNSELVLHSATDGHFVRQYRLPPFAKVQNGWLAHFNLNSKDHIYGLGEKWAALNKRGQLIHSYNHDALGVNTECSYKNVPFAWSPSGWGIFCHTPSPVLHGVGFPQWSQRAYGILVEDDSLDLFLFEGMNGAELIKHYTTLTGRAPAPPKWSLGVIVSKAYYKDEEELLSTAREIRKRKMPCDTITLDGRAWLDTRTRFTFDWDASRYPNPSATLQKLKALDFKICIWEYPLVSTYNPLYKIFAEKGWFLKDADSGETYEHHWESEPFGDVLTPLPVSGIIDFTHPDAYAYWRDRHEELFAIGVDMIKADFGEQVPDNIIAYNGEHGRALHNVYAYLYNKCVHEAAEKFSASGAFLFSRSSWVGCQRFPSQWGGDPQADWEGLAASIRGGLSWGMSGAPFYATDVGGFYGDQRDPKLYVRWLQAGVFSAHMRLHGIGAREPWTYGKKAEQAAMTALRLRYRLLPYLEQTVAQSSKTGLPVQRGMALACPDEREAWGFDEQFFLGEDLLVAPCLRADDTVEVYLPEGYWQRFPEFGPRLSGGRTYRFTLKLDEIAAFAPEGRRIKLGPDIQYTAQIP